MQARFERCRPIDDLFAASSHAGEPAQAKRRQRRAQGCERGGCEYRCRAPFGGQQRAADQPASFEAGLRASTTAGT